MRLDIVSQELYHLSRLIELVLDHELAHELDDHLSTPLVEGEVYPPFGLLLFVFIQTVLAIEMT